jgi:hypothetical protein
MIQAKFGPVVSEEKIYFKVYRRKIQKNPVEYIAIKFDTYVIFFQNYG